MALSNEGSPCTLSLVPPIAFTLLLVPPIPCCPRVSCPRHSVSPRAFWYPCLLVPCYPWPPTPCGRNPWATLPAPPPYILAVRPLILRTGRSNPRPFRPPSPCPPGQSLFEYLGTRNIEISTFYPPRNKCPHFRDAAAIASVLESCVCVCCGQCRWKRSFGFLRIHQTPTTTIAV